MEEQKKLDRLQKESTNQFETLETRMLAELQKLEQEWQHVSQSSEFQDAKLEETQLVFEEKKSAIERDRAENRAQQAAFNTRKSATEAAGPKVSTKSAQLPLVQTRDDLVGQYCSDCQAIVPLHEFLLCSSSALEPKCDGCYEEFQRNQRFFARLPTGLKLAPTQEAVLLEEEFAELRIATPAAAAAAAASEPTFKSS